MIKESLFAAEEREAKLDRLGDVLQVFARFAGLMSGFSRCPTANRLGQLKSAERMMEYVAP
ncbi:MAG: hypothetical protein V9G29_03455 [Burkholderiaceae bacterium]